MCGSRNHRPDEPTNRLRIARCPDLTENPGTSRDLPAPPVSNITNLLKPTTEFPPPPETA